MTTTSPANAPGLVTTLYLALRAVIGPTVFGVSAVALDGQGRVLLVRHSYRPGWHLPGGGVNAGEPPEAAALRELEEETGLVESTPPEFLGLHTRRVAWFSHVVAVYRVRNVRVEFKPNLEIREIVFCDPAAPPEGTSAGTRRRLAELTGKAPRSPYW